MNAVSSGGIRLGRVAVYGEKGAQTEYEYDDFDLVIKKEDGGYATSVRWREFEAAEPFVLPWQTQEQFVAEIHQMSGTRARSRSAKTITDSAGLAEEVGKRLFSALFTGQVRELYGRAYTLAEDNGRGLRLRLRTAADRRLLDVPWEYMYDRDRGGYVALAKRTQVVRYPVAPSLVQTLELKPPLRVLVAISKAAPPNTEPLDVEKEWMRLAETALGDARRDGLIVLHRVPGDLYEITKALDETEYHVFHYIGHSGFDAAAGDGVLILEGQNGRVVTRSAQDVAQMLGPHTKLKLAVFNSCEGARSAAEDPFAGVASSVVQQGVPAVIGMQFEITDAIAITFAQEFYTSLAKGEHADIALLKARRSIFSASKDIEWGTPVLFLRSQDGRIFSPQDSPPERRQQLRRLAARYERGVQALEEGEWSAARDHLAAVLEEDPDFGDCAARLEDARRALRRSPAYGEGADRVPQGAEAAEDEHREVNNDVKNVVAIVVGLLAVIIIIYLAVQVVIR